MVIVFLQKEGDIMSKTFNRGMSEAEKLISKERVMCPITWSLDAPVIDPESDRVEVNVKFYIHNKDRDRDRIVWNADRWDANMEVFFEKDEISSVLKKAVRPIGFEQPNENGRIADARDRLYSELRITLCDIYEKNAVRDGSLVYKSILTKLFHDEELNSKLKELTKIETILFLVRRPSVFFSEELQELFA